MTMHELTRTIVKQRIADGDRVFLADRPYAPQTLDHQQLWPRIVAAIEASGARGAMYATSRAIGGTNKNYAGYLIGQLQVLRCPALEDRIGMTVTK